MFLKASPDIVGKFTDSFDVVTKHEIYHIPITAQIVGDSQVRTEEIRLSKGVREVEESKKRGQDV